MNNSLISILIPTKNRAVYALHSIKSVCCLNEPLLEVIVADNSDDDALRYMINREINDPRVRYVYTPPPLSSIGNFNIAVANATGKYVCMIGDDDTVNPELLEAVYWADDLNIDCVTGALAANYRWADTSLPDTLFSKMTDSTLVITPFSSTIHKIDTKKAIIQLAKNGATYYLDYYFPKLYHGIAKRSLFDKIKDITGSYIGGLSPDIYSAVALCALTESAYYIDYPLTIPGVCPTSSSVQEGGLRKSNSKRLEDAPHFRHRGVYGWAPQVPKVYCAETIWADSALAAMRDFKLLEGLSSFNRARLYAYLITADFSLLPDVFAHSVAYSNKNLPIVFFDILLTIFNLFSGPIRRFFYPRAIRRLLVLLRVRAILDVRNLPTVGDAQVALSSYLRSKKLSFKTLQK